MCSKNIQSFKNKKNQSVLNWVIICYGNILRSQVLEQYLRHYSELWDVKIKFESAGIAGWHEFPDTEKLLDEIRQELKKREIPCSLQRNAWDRKIEKKVISADIIICSDKKIKATVLERMNHQINNEKISTFYEIISEGEIDFQDTYDYAKKRQDPNRFRNAFDELDRIAKKIIGEYRNSL